MTKTPGYTGSCEINGAQYWISAWLNTAQGGANNGDKFFSMKFKRKDAPASAMKPDQPEPPTEDSEVPF